MDFSPAVGSDMDQTPEEGRDLVGSSPEAAVHVDGPGDEPPDAPPPPEEEARALVLPEGISGDQLLGPIQGEESPRGGEFIPGEERSYHRMANGKAHRLVLAYSRQVERRPRCIMLLMTIVVVALIASMFKIPAVEFDFSTFIRADGDAMLRREAYLLALGEREGPNARRRLLEGGRVPDLENLVEVLPEDGANVSGNSERRLYAQLIYTQSMSILYESEGSIFDKQVLRAVRDFEIRMRSLTGWQAMCGEMVATDLAYLCDPGESLVAYAWATQVPAAPSDGAGARLVLLLDGQSEEPIPPPAFLAYIEHGGHPVLDFSRFFPGEYSPPLRNGTGAEAAGEEPRYLRSRFWFSFDVTGESQSEIEGYVQNAKAAWGDFVRNELYPVLKEGQTGVKVRYTGDQLTSYELIQTLQNDLLFAIGSVLMVLLCLWFQLQAVWMSLASLFVILAALPIAYVLTPAEKLTITSFLALFLIVGIGSDTVFVFGDFWEQERHRKLDDRVAVVLMEAGKNCFATSLTTAASFLANMASVLQPLREFGFFMGLCVLWVFVLIAVYLPPMLVLQARSRQAKEAAKAAALEVQPGSMAAIVPAQAAQQAPVPKPETGCPRLARSYLRGLALRVSFCPGVVAALTVLLVALFALGISLDIRLATGVPQIFPNGHNQVEVPLLEAKFSPIARVGVEIRTPSLREVVCNVDSILDGSEDCSLFWCDQATAFGYSWSSSPSDGNCWASPLRASGTTTGLANCSSISFQARVASPGRPSTAEARTALESMSRTLTNSRASNVGVAINTGELRTLVAESWSTGNVVTSRFFNLGTATIALPAADGGTEACTASGLCFWDVPACDAPGWTSLGNHSPSRRLDVSRAEAEDEDALPLVPARQLQVTQTVPSNKQIDISIVWGIRAPRQTPLLGPNAEQWSYDPTFQMQNPWAQRAVFSMCQDELPPELRVLTRRCWIQDFRTRLLSMSRRFPSRDFTAEVLYFSNGNLPMQEQLWMMDGAVAAAMLHFKVDVAFDIGATAISEYKAEWDRFVDERNALASETANRAWHTAQAWVLAEAELAIINSTIVTIVVAAVCGWACMLLFTNDPTLAFLVLMLVLGVVTGLAFFMIVIMAWPLGPIEVISLVVFVGYSVTYSLHVAHIFGEVDGTDDEVPRSGKEEGEDILAPDMGDAPPLPPPLAPPPDQAGAKSEEGSALSGQAIRAVRVRKALMRIGISTLSSTLSTVGASAFLLSATMQVFTKLGSVVIAVSVLSCVASLVVLPAILVLFGPGLQPWYHRCCGCCCRQRANRHSAEQALDSGGRGNSLPVAEGRILD